MIVEGMWRLMRDKHGCTDADLIEMVYAIDLEDCRLDGRKGKKPVQLLPEVQSKSDAESAVLSLLRGPHRAEAVPVIFTPPALAGSGD